MSPQKRGTEVNFEAVIAYIESDRWLNLTASLLTLITLAVIGHYFVKFVLRRVAHVVTPRLSTIASDLINDDVLFGRFALFVPTLIIYQGVDLIWEISPVVTKFIQKSAVIATVIIGLRIASRLMTRGNEIYTRYPISRSRPIKGYLQIITIILYILGFIVVIATAVDKSPLVFLSGLGAMTAIILLVFRDTLLSLVAGAQLTTNDLIRVGDWIDMPQFGADGDVVDIALHVVKVQNWDKTITMIPTHKFLEHSFKNWRGMSESGGRRIKRAIYLDMSSIRFLEDDEIERFGSYALLRDYIKQKTDELREYNKDRLGNGVLVTNARRLTNVGTFRAYLSNYLRQHPMIHQNMTFLVRQLQPSAEGLPIEIYVFVADTRWAFYEAAQADIFDHILAVIDQFGLKVFQSPSGADFRHVLTAVTEPARTN